MRRIHAVIGVVLALGLAGCELITSFDGAKLRAAEDDASADAGLGDDGAAGLADAGLADDASSDGGALEAGDAGIALGHLFATEVAYLKPSNTTPGVHSVFGGFGGLYDGSSWWYGYPRFPVSVALSADGSRLAVGASGESGGSSGVNGDQTQGGDGGLGASGAVYVFVRDASGAWSQEAYVKSSAPTAGAGFGTWVALSGDGNTLVASDSAWSYVFGRAGSVWSQTATIPGTAAALSGDGSTLALAVANKGTTVYTHDTRGWNLQATLPGYSVPMAFSADGNVLAIADQGVLARSGASWALEGSLTNPTTVRPLGVKATADLWAVALSSDGNTVAAGFGADYGEISIHPYFGLALQFSRAAGWAQSASFADPAPAPLAFDNNSAFGASVALSGAGDRMVVGAAGYSALGNNTPGAAYVYSRGADGTWARSFVRPSSTPLIDSSLVRAVAISADGTTLAVGTPFDASGARGINGDQNDTSAPGSGAVHVFR